MTMTLICLGDSLTYGYEVRRSRVWPALAAEKSGARILNKGINGLMTSGMLACFARDVLEEKPDAVLLMGGANDILAGLGPEEPLGNMAAMVERAENAGIAPLIGIPVPFCPPIREDWAAMADFPSRTPVYEAFVDRLHTLALERARAIVDFRSALAGYAREAGVPSRSVYLDGIHLNEDGHRLFAETLATVLRERFMQSRIQS